VGQPTAVKDWNGQETTTTYDALGQVKTVTDAKHGVVRYEYYSNGLLKEVVDERRGTDKIAKTKQEYDALGRAVKVTDAEQNITLTKYDAAGQVIATRDERGYWQSFERNLLGQVVAQYACQEVNAEPETCTKQLLVKRNIDAFDNTLEEWNAENKEVARHEYDSRNLVVKTTHCNDAGCDSGDLPTILYTYDDAGNLHVRTDEDGGTTTYAYDEENRPKTATFTRSGYTEVRSFEYDPQGLVTKKTSPKHQAAGLGEQSFYDALGRLVVVQDEANLKTAYAYDKNDNPRFAYTARTSASAGQTVTAFREATASAPSADIAKTEYEYDELNRKRFERQHRLKGGPLSTEWIYDGAGNVVVITDPSGQSFIYDYDKLGQRKHGIYSSPRGEELLSLARLDYAYDPNGNVESVVETKKLGAVTKTDSLSGVYDHLDRLTKATKQLADAGDAVAVGYEYWPTGTLKRVTSPSGSVSYEYDVRSRLKKAIVPSEGETVEAETVYAYHPVQGYLDTIAYANGATAKYAYHPSRQVRSIEHRKDATAEGLLAKIEYTYDANGNRLSQQETLRENNADVVETTVYQYDAVDRMRQYGITDGSGLSQTSYTFEGYNRKTEEIVGASATTKTYSYDELNHLMNIAVVDAQGSYEVGYTYDNNGNTLTRTNSRDANESQTYAYDVKDQLVKVTNGAGAVLGRYDYDFNGLRVRERETDRENVDTYYNGSSVIEERKADDGTLLAHYRYGDRLLSLATPSRPVQFYHHDALGTVVALSSPKGAIEKTYRVNPFGGIRRETGESLNKRVFTGHVNDSSTGLVYMKARYYDPEAGRFLTQDSYLGQAGEPPSLNRYLYAYGNPGTWVDPTGHQSARQSLVELYNEGEEQGGVIGTGKQILAGAGHLGWLVSNFVSGGSLEQSEEAIEQEEAGLITMEERDRLTRDALGKAAGALAVTVATGGLGRLAAGVGGMAVRSGLSQVGGKIVGGMVSGAVGGALYQGTHDVVAGELSSAAQWASSIGVGAAFGFALPALGAGAKRIAQTKVAQAVASSLRAKGTQLGAALGKATGNASRVTREALRGGSDFVKKKLGIGAEGLGGATATKSWLSRLKQRAADFEQRRPGVREGGFVRNPLAKEGGRAAAKGVVNPADLRWCQTTAGGRGRAAEIRASMAARGWDGPPIDVVRTADGLVTVDHTRAAVALEQEITQVPVRIHAPGEALPADMLTRPWNRAGGTASTWGEAVALRGAGQSPPIGPTGTPTPPRLPK
jgi:RHS repeat-associated protein